MDGKKAITYPMSCCSYVKSSDHRFFQKPVVLRGENVAEKFLDHVMAVANEIRDFLRKKVPMKKLAVQQQHDCEGAIHTVKYSNHRISV